MTEIRRIPATKNIAGSRFGKLKVLEFVGYANRRSLWRCRCDCGAICIVRANSLNTGNTRSCGCIHRKHGATGTPEWEIWMGMIKRCESPSQPMYRMYGGRGIRVCKRWRHSFLAFLKDMGKRPSPDYSLDRVDTNGNYTLKNCRWATRTQQQRNRRMNTLITHDGLTLCLAEWVERTGLRRNIIMGRTRRGWPVAEALTRPARPRRYYPPGDPRRTPLHLRTKRARESLKINCPQP